VIADFRCCGEFITAQVEIFHHLARIAELTHQTIESLTVQSIKTNLPPTVENAPLFIPASLQAMQTLSVDELFKMAHSQVPTVQQQRHLALLERNPGESFGRIGSLL